MQEIKKSLDNFFKIDYNSIVPKRSRKGVNKMEKTYTEQEIKDWFKSMMKEYPNSQMNQHLQSVYDEMFDPFWKRNNLKTFVEKRVDK